jgi:formylglycine-generating enzyme required for sulfatase activity
VNQPSGQTSAFFVSGGTLKPNVPSYVERAADREFLERLSDGDFCYVLTPRQMGKSSLMARTATILRENGVLTAIIDLTTIGEGGKSNESASSWYLGIARAIARELGLKADLKSWWQERDGLPEQQRFTEFLEDLVLGATPQRVVVFVDEIDATLRLPFTDDFFAGIRACYNARANKPAFERLTFALLGVASPSELIKDTSRTPFNIGHRIELADFTIQEARPLADGFPMPRLDASRALERVLHWTGGQPYLTQKLCLELSRRLQRQTAPDSRGVETVPPREDSASTDLGLSRSHSDSELAGRVDDLLEELIFSPEGSRDEVHFKYIRDRIRQDPHTRRVLRTYLNVLRGERVQDNPQSLIHNALRLAGLVRRSANGHLEVRNLIYQRVFDLNWVRQALAVDPTRRRAFALGVAAILLVVGPVGYWLWEGSETARAQARVEALLAARPEVVPNAIANLQPLQHRALPLLRAEITNAPAGSPNKLNATLGLAALGDVRVPDLLDSAAEASPAQWTNVTRALAEETASVLAEISRRIDTNVVPEARFRLAMLAWVRGDPAPAQRITQRRPNPAARTAFIHGYSHWLGGPLRVVEVLQAAAGDPAQADFLSALCAALGLVERRTLASEEQEALLATLRQMYTQAPDGATHGAASYALTRWGEKLPPLPASTRVPSPDRNWFVNTQGMTMIEIPAGSFRMGDPTGESHEKPFQVMLTRSFFISDREVTLAQIREFHTVASSPTYTPDAERITDWKGEYIDVSPTPDCPVQSVSWLDAVKFCNWLSRREGRPICYTASTNAAGEIEWHWDREAGGYRLPTEAEWEYACRAGSQSSWAFGDDEGLLGEYSWYYYNSRDRSWPAGSKLPNAWGLFDMHGNVWEWCQDWFGAYPEEAEPVPDPTGPDEGQSRVLRGGAWNRTAERCRSAYRSNGHPTYRNIGIGFRVVLAPRSGDGSEGRATGSERSERGTF